jgi:putative ABC transport system permease protein
MPPITTPTISRLQNSAGLFCREAGRALLRHKLRSGLTALGIMIGIAAVVWVVAIGKAGSARAEAQLANLGDNLVWIEAGSRNVNGVRNGNHGDTSLTFDDMQAIRRETPLIKSVSPNVDGRLRLIYGNRNWLTGYRGVSTEYLDIKKWEIAEGSAFTDEQGERAESVCLIGQTVREQLFGPGEAVGQVIRVQGQVFQVIGVLGRKGQSGFGQDQDDTLLMPYETAQSKIRGKGMAWLDDILASARSRDQVNAAIDQVSALLRQRHRLQPGQEDDFNIRRPDEVLKAQVEASRSLSLLLVSVAAIALWWAASAS